MAYRLEWGSTLPNDSEARALLLSKLHGKRDASQPTAKMAVLFQNSALPGVRANGITSRMFVTPVINMSIRSKPRPKPEWGTVP